ncbi:MAG: hypothetical protein NVS2B16_11570 [Chloroflexota bacterium]
MTVMDLSASTGGPAVPARVDGDHNRSPLTKTTRYMEQIAIFSMTSVVTAGVDLWTKQLPHAIILHHYNAAAPTKLVALGLCLFVFALHRTPISALAAGLYFGALCGNGGELLVHGYATDWILVDPRPFTTYALVTNVADICVALGLSSLVVEFMLMVRRRKRSHRPERSVRITMIFAGLCGVLTGVVTRDLSIGMIVAILVDSEARIIVWISHKQQSSTA